MEASPCFFIWRYTTNSKDKKYLEASFLKVRLYFIAYNLIGFSSITVVDADNDAHGKYLLSFQNLSGIYNKRRGRISLPRRNFPSEIAAVLSVKTGDRLSKPYRQW